MYIYESHLGGLYATEEELSLEDRSCGQCGDWDLFLGQANTKSEAIKLLNEEDWVEGYIQEFLEKYFN